MMISSSRSFRHKVTPFEVQDSIEVAKQVCTNEGPPNKRRRSARGRSRSFNFDQSDTSQARVDRLLDVLYCSKKIVVIAGAGISVSAGIPDFRSRHGLFATLRDKHKIKGGGKSLFDASVYANDKSTALFHTMISDLSRLTKQAEPTAFHHMLAKIAREGRLMRLYSQNIDCLDTSLESLATSVPLDQEGPWPTTVQLHGGLDKMLCSLCKQVDDFNASLFNGPEPPLCKACTQLDEKRTIEGKRSRGIGRLRPYITLYNDDQPDLEAIIKVCEADMTEIPDAVIVVGTSLRIPGVQNIVKDFRRATRRKKGSIMAWVNPDPVPGRMRGLWDLVIHSESDTIARLFQERRVRESEHGCIIISLTQSSELQPTRVATQQYTQNPSISRGKRNKGRQRYTHIPQHEAGSGPQQLAINSTPDNDPGNTATSQSLSLSTMIAAPEFDDACSLKLSDDDISCLPSGSPLTSKIVDVALYLVGALDPINTVVVDSTIDKIITPPSADQTLLIPIPIPSIESLSGHWVLAIHNHDGIRLLDSSPSNTHTQFARERIETLYAEPPGYSSGQVENFPQIIESRDSGVAVLVNAIRIVAVSLGSRVEEPIVLNVELWRDVLTMILKLTTGETYHLPWADTLNHEAIVLDGDETVDGERQLLWHPKSSLVDYQLACEAIASQQRYLDAQLKTIQAAFAKKQSQTVSLGRDAGSISSTLHSLLNGAISHKELAEAEGQRCTDALGTIAQLEAQWNESWTLRGGCQISNESGRLRKRVLEVQERLSCRTRTLSSLDKCLKAMDELVSGLTNTTG